MRDVNDVESGELAVVIVKFYLNYEGCKPEDIDKPLATTEIVLSEL